VANFRAVEDSRTLSSYYWICNAINRWFI